ncbi:MAG TPA: hypothetical protein VFI33_12750 [Puia sp.]|nr:hypothetical protein [Puia sp.]
MGRVTGICAGFFLMMLFLVRCKKEYSYEGGVAAFTIVNSGANCVSTLSGHYNTGLALDQSNSVQLQIDVISPGKFSIQTNTADGMFFSTSGSLSDTGIQTLTLAGNGIPSKAGDFSFTPGVTATCDFIVTVTDKQVAVSDYILTGAPNACENVQVNGQYSTGKEITPENFIALNVNVGALGDYTIHTDTLNGISFSASGTFTKTGPQIINLMGSGNPDQAGHLIFTPKGNNGSGCTFDLTVQKSGPPATYVIESGQNLCIGAAAGSFTAGTPLDGSNTYTLEVFVADLGNFTIATKSVNGVYFYYTGEFTTAGDQYVTLQGYGTPAAVGNFTLTPQIIGPAPLGGTACDFSLPVK